MPRLELQSLECVKTEDLLGADECELTIFADGQLVRRIFAILGENESLNLTSEKIDFAAIAAAQLHDIDNPPVGDDHDYLGAISIPTTPVSSQIGKFTGSGARYVLRYDVASWPSPIQPAGPSFLTITSETGVPHSACLFHYPNGQEKWFGFKPKVPLSPFGAGFIDTGNRQAHVNHSITVEVPEWCLMDSEQMITSKYSNATYQLGILDCVSFAADVARLCELRVANANFTPFGLITYIREYNTFINYI